MNEIKKCLVGGWVGGERGKDLLVERGDGLDGGVAGVYVDSLLRVRVEVEQRGHQVLHEGQSLARQVTSLQLEPTDTHTDRHKDRRTDRQTDVRGAQHAAIPRINRAWGL